MMKYARKNQLKQAEMQGNKAKTADKETGSRKMITQLNKKQLKQAETHSQSGRSMVEMLGVLAIIAILSIGGIVGFRLAMNYYQANQIAHEINIMRTDAQIKIAQGTEKLILGEPYDPLNESTLGHIQFNDDYPVDFACALADEDTIELSNISCHVANAYYIELQNIPEGVCRPLAELVNGMSNVIAFDVNKNEYPGEGKCEAGNGNVLNAVFSAEAVSELKVCTEDTDCESENALYCDPSRHVCVRCYEDNQCAHNQYCEDNTCVTCESGVWNGENCVECTADDDCADKTDTPVCNMAEYKCVECLTYENCIDKTGTPQCDEASHTCKSCIDIDLSKPVWADTQCVECAESTDCSDELVCRGNECTTCQTEDECQEKGTTYHCSKEDTCIQCDTNEVWDDENRECVECLSSADCKNSDTPKCNTDTNTCVECIESTDCSNELVCKENTCSPCETEEECQEKGTTYHCSKDKTCIQCLDNQVWGGQDKECVECTADNDCADTPDTPVCYTAEYKCVECLTYNDCTDTPETPQCDEASHTCKSCYELDPNKPLWNGNECVECPADQPWNGDFCGCTSNENCATDEYCSITISACKNGAPVISASDNTHCREIAGNYNKKTINGRTYFSSTETLNWWGADNFCKAIAKQENKPYHLISIEELGCTPDDLNCENSDLRHQLYNGTPPTWNIAVWTSTIDGNSACGNPYHAYVNNSSWHNKRLEPCARNASIHYALCVAE